MKSLPLLTALVLGSGPLAAAEFWLSPTGDDRAAGTAAAPFASLTRAAEQVRTERRARPDEPVTVWLAPGDYPVLTTFTFGPADSGTATAPVTWRAVVPGTARLVGARAIEAARLQPLTDPVLQERADPSARPHLVELDLAGLDLRQTGPLPDFARDRIDLFQVFHGGRLQPLSRWPNGEYGYTTMARVLDSGSFQPRTPQGGTFEAREDRLARWLPALADGGVWLRGFWRVPWVAEVLRVRAIDPAARTITFAISTSSGIGSKYSPQVGDTRVGDGKEPWHALNLLEEIDEPGEWAVDFRRRKLYLWPPAGDGGLAIADNARPMLAFQRASFITLQQVTLDQQLGDGIAITDGEGVRLLGCRVEQVRRTGIIIRGGLRHEVRSCDLSEIGLSAIDVLGGDRATLAPAGHEIVNNHIHRVALAGPVAAITAGLDTRRQGIVGCRFAHNRIHDATYSGIVFGGNDNLFEYNEIYRVGLDGGDLGGFYTTGGWTTRGNVVRHNFIHHAENANAIYMDDGSSGLEVTGNVIYRAEAGIFIGGGHDHVARGNLIVATAHAFHVDDRGIARRYVADDPRLRTDLDSVPWRESPWRERYPALAGLLEADPSVPRGNVLDGNVVVACPDFARRSGRPETLAGFAFGANPEIGSLAVLADPADLDFRLLEDAAAALLPPFDLTRFGLQADAWRPEVPPRDLELLRTGSTRRRAFDSQQDVDAYPR